MLPPDADRDVPIGMFLPRPYIPISYAIRLPTNTDQ